MSNQKTIRAAYYLRISTEAQELDNQRGEIMPFIERRGWKLVLPFEDVMSGRKTEKDRPGFAAMLKAAHQRKFDIVVFWALDRLTREGTRATLNYLQRLESKGVDEGVTDPTEDNLLADLVIVRIPLGRSRSVAHQIRVEKLGLKKNSLRRLFFCGKGSAD